MREFFQRNIAILVLSAILVPLGLVYGAVSAGNRAELASQEQEIADLEARMQSKLAAAEEQQQLVVDAAQGTNAARVEADTEVIRQLMKTVATWGSGEEYSQARESVMRRYKLPEDSQFMTDFFQEPVFNTDSSGKRYYLVDTDGLNSSLSSVTVKPLGVLGTEYRYMVMADIRSFSNDGKASATRTSVVHLTLDGDGTVGEISGYASTAKPRSSR